MSSKTGIQEAEWFGNAPLNWARLPLGSCFVERKQIVSDTDYPPLSVTKNGVVPQLSTAAKTDYGDARKCVRSGDFVINSRSDRRGSSGISDRDGSVSVVYTVLSPRASLDAGFVHYLLRSSAFQNEYYRWGNGIVDDLWSTRYSAMKKILLAVPPIYNQKCIVNYLDNQINQIDELIEKQMRFIATLRDRRLAMAESVVGSPKLTGSSKIKHYLRAVRQGWSPQCYAWPADGVEFWAVLKTGAPNAGYFRPNENKALPTEENPRPETVVRAGELIVSRASTKDLVGSAAVVHGYYPRLMLSDKLYALEIDETRAVPDYVALVLGTRAWRDLIKLEATGSSPSMQNISQADILNLPIFLPPTDEQHRRLEVIAAKVAKTDALIAQARLFIALARERRSALITAAVTGQINVREAS